MTYATAGLTSGFVWGVSDPVALQMGVVLSSHAGYCFLNLPKAYYVVVGGRGDFEVGFGDLIRGDGAWG